MTILTKKITKSFLLKFSCKTHVSKYDVFSKRNGLIYFLRKETLKIILSIKLVNSDWTTNSNNKYTEQKYDYKMKNSVNKIPILERDKLQGLRSYNEKNVNMWVKYWNIKSENCSSSLHFDQWNQQNFALLKINYKYISKNRKFIWLI